MVVVMAAACHHEAQNVVQDELDNVVGRNRGMHLPLTRVGPELTGFV